MPGPALYARYVPPKASASAVVKGTENNQNAAPSTSSPLKRKREDAIEKKQKHRRPENVNVQAGKNVEDGRERSEDHGLQQKSTDEAKLSSSLQTAVRSKEIEIEKSPERSAVAQANDLTSPQLGEKDGKSKKKEKRKRLKMSQNEEEKDVEMDDSTARHAGVLSKFQNALQTSAKNAPADEDVDMNGDEDEQELHDLVPIPMPEQPPIPEAFSALAALPPWLSNPVKIPKTANVPFADLLDVKVAHQLNTKGFARALPVQAGVLPLLLPTSNQHPGDLCVSAATGSGKTLAYVLPIIESLRSQGLGHLRALIVVPTRELVSQVQRTAEMCSAGTGLRVGTAVGHHTFKNEQKALVKAGQIYDPEGHENLRKKAENVDELDMLDTDDNENFYDLLPYHIPEYVSNVDVLICTPGRLVDHIKSTKGFTLQHLEWFVIDEADRLLDQSFQEWVEVLQPAMNPQAKEPQSGKPFRPVFLSPYIGLRPDGWVRKVVLSATLTRDLQKLGSLNLRNPKLVLVEGSTNEHIGDEVVKNSASGNFALPSTLQEFGVPAGDGSEKPLYLLKLLQQIFEDASGDKKLKSNGRILEDPAIEVDSDDDDSSSASSESDSDSDSDSSLSEDISDTASTVSSSSSSTASLSSSDDTDGASSTSSLASSHVTPTPPITSVKNTTSPTPNALIFVSSNESAARLQHLLTRLKPAYSPQIALLTKSGTSAITRKALSAFASGSIRILIATDRASRGLDLPTLSNVINYDIPHSVTSYVHRVGRTARAGKHGKAWTLVAEREAAWFWNVIARGKGSGTTGMESDRIDRDEGRKLGRVRLDVEEEDRGRYEQALESLRQGVEGKAK